MTLFLNRWLYVCILHEFLDGKDGLTHLFLWLSLYSLALNQLSIPT